MYIFAVILSRTVLALLSLLETAMFIRALLSFFSRGESFFEQFLALITEPFIAPVRFLLMRFRFVQESPIDLSFFATFLIISVLQMTLPVIPYY